MRVLITGANRGLGLCLTDLCLEHGHEVWACCRQGSHDEALKTLEEKAQGRLHILPMDVTSEDSVRQARDEYISCQTGKAEETPYLDCVINNAGVLLETKYDLSDPIVNLDIPMLRRTLEVNTVGPAIVLKYFMPLVYTSDAPCILNITSEAGHLKTGLYTYLAYGVSKHGANMYTQKIRNYLAMSDEHQNVRIFMIHPGRMNTEMGKENAQIEPEEAAAGIIDIMEGKTDPKMDIPFVNYRGEPMPY